MRTQASDKCIVAAGFSLIEILAVVVISGMMIIAVLSVYSRAQSTITAIDAKIDNQMMPNEIMQRIAEDIDRLTLPGLDTRIAVANKFDGVYNLSQMTITTQYYDSGNPPKAQVFEKVVWQSAYDPVEDALTLYRSHTGLNLADKIVDKDLAEQQRGGRELCVPVTTGITFFEIVVPRGNTLLREWRLSTIPRAIRIAISLAAPQEDWTTGDMVVFDEDKVTRTVAIDRTRMISYKFVRQDFTLDETEPNSLFTDGLDIGGDEDTETATDTGEGTNNTDPPTNGPLDTELRDRTKE